MYLKFIGTDGSMGLRNGHVYYVVLEYNRGLFWVVIPKFFNQIDCPYETINAFAKNWELPKANSCSISSVG